MGKSSSGSISARSANANAKIAAGRAGSKSAATRARNRTLGAAGLFNFMASRGGQQGTPAAINRKLGAQKAQRTRARNKRARARANLGG